MLTLMPNFFAHSFDKIFSVLNGRILNLPIVARNLNLFTPMIDLRFLFDNSILRSPFEGPLLREGLVRIPVVVYIFLLTGFRMTVLGQELSTRHLYSFGKSLTDPCEAICDIWISHFFIWSFVLRLLGQKG
jgi:hypothetical protein